MLMIIITPIMLKLRWSLLFRSYQTLERPEQTNVTSSTKMHHTLASYFSLIKLECALTGRGDTVGLLIRHDGWCDMSLECHMVPCCLDNLIKVDG